MKKTTIKKMLALVVGVIIIAASLTAGFGASAAAPADVDAPYYGTEADGFDSKYASWPMNLKPADDIYNLDFESGFRFWSGKDASATGVGDLASDNMELVTEGTNKYVKIPASGYVTSIRTILLATKAAVGDKIVAVYDAKGADATTLKVQIKQDHIKTELVWDETTGVNITDPTNANKRQNASPGSPSIIVGTATDPTEFAVQTAAAGWTTYVTENSNPVEDPTGKSSAGCEATIYLQVILTAGSENAGATLDAAIDNIRLVKVTGEEGAEVYTDLATGEEIKESAGGTTPPPAPSVTLPAYYGTEDKGFDSTNCSYPFYLKPADDIYNLDFSNGFVCWAGRKNGGTEVYAGDNMEIVTEANGNKYAKIPATGYVTSIRTCLFAAKNVAIGDKLVAIYDIKGADAEYIRIQVLQEPLKAGIEYDATTGMSTTMKDDGSALLNPSPGMTSIMVGTGYSHNEFDVNLGAEGWTTYIGDTTSNVSDPANASSTATMDQTIYLQVAVTCGDAGAAAGDVLDAAVDNIRIAKVVDGVYYNIVDNSVIYDPNATGDDGTGSDDGSSGNGGSAATGDSVLALAALFFVSGAAVFGTAKAMKKR